MSRKPATSSSPPISRPMKRFPPLRCWRFSKARSNVSKGIDRGVSAHPLSSVSMTITVPPGLTTRTISRTPFCGSFRCSRTKRQNTTSTESDSMPISYTSPTIKLRLRRWGWPDARLSAIWRAFYIVNGSMSRQTTLPVVSSEETSPANKWAWKPGPHPTSSTFIPRLKYLCSNTLSELLVRCACQYKRSSSIVSSTDAGRYLCLFIIKIINHLFLATFTKKGAAAT